MTERDRASESRAELPQEFPRELALLRLDDVLPGLPEGAREPYRALFEQRRTEPLSVRGLLLVGEGGVRPLMAVMRLVVLRFRDLNFERFEQAGSAGRYLSAYIAGENLAAPLPERANALFIERADRADQAVAGALLVFPAPLFATWEGPPAGPVWDVLQDRCETLWL